MLHLFLCCQAHFQMPTLKLAVLCHLHHSWEQRLQPQARVQQREFCQQQVWLCLICIRSFSYSFDFVWYHIKRQGNQTASYGSWTREFALLGTAGASSSPFTNGSTAVVPTTQSSTKKPLVITTSKSSSPTTVISTAWAVQSMERRCFLKLNRRACQLCNH